MAAVRYDLDQLNKESNAISKEVGQIKKVCTALAKEQLPGVGCRPFHSSCFVVLPADWRQR
jgi:hypothetical protein